MRAVLLTGFAAFGGETVNPSWQAAKRLTGESVAGRPVVTRELPTEFGRAGQMICDLIDQFEPALVMCCGQAGRAHEIRVERLAVNLRDARRADNAGNRPLDEEIVPGGPVAYWATVPTKRMVSALHAAKIPAGISYSAGSYVCNEVFYTACHHARQSGLSARVGFLHVPYLPEQVVHRRGFAGMSVQMTAAAMRTAMEAALQPDRGRERGGGDGSH